MVDAILFSSFFTDWYPVCTASHSHFRYFHDIICTRSMLQVEMKWLIYLKHALGTNEVMEILEVKVATTADRMSVNEEEAEQNGGQYSWLEILFLTGGSRLASNGHLYFMAVLQWKLGYSPKANFTVVRPTSTYMSGSRKWLAVKQEGRKWGSLLLWNWRMPLININRMYIFSLLCPWTDEKKKLQQSTPLPRQVLSRRRAENGNNIRKWYYYCIWCEATLCLKLWK